MTTFYELSPKAIQHFTAPRISTQALLQALPHWFALKETTVKIINRPIEYIWTQ